MYCSIVFDYNFCVHTILAKKFYLNLFFDVGRETFRVIGSYLNLRRWHVYQRIWFLRPIEGYRAPGLDKRRQPMFPMLANLYEYNNQCYHGKCVPCYTPYLKYQNLSLNITCSVSTKLATFPFESQPRRKNLVPARFVDLRDIKVHRKC